MQTRKALPHVDGRRKRLGRVVELRALPFPVVVLWPRRLLEVARLGRSVLIPPTADKDASPSVAEPARSANG